MATPTPLLPLTRSAAHPVRAAESALNQWFAARGWRPAPFQREVWTHWREGRSGLLVTPTGSGKTLAAVGGLLLQGLQDQARGVEPPPRGAPRLRLLWVTPLRALATDTTQALQTPVEALGLGWTVAKRTGDASSRDRRLARQGGAELLVITPESLALLLSYPDTAQQFAGLRGVIVDEWHELLGNKRGVLLQLCLARVRALAPQAVVWGLSATLGNLEEARDVLLPQQPDAPIVRSARRRGVTLKTLLPEAGERFAWAGHLGLSQLDRVVRLVSGSRSAIVFTNTRAQAELWHRALASIWLEDAGTLALHHGSLDVALRHAAEQGLRDGRVRCVVATSSLDLGVDFPAVERVLQIGSPKGLARLLQRAGRASHRPGASSTIHCVPTHALELAEYAAARRAIAQGRIESRRPPRLALDVLSQHCVTLALGGGFESEALFAEVRRTHAFAELTSTQWQAVLRFIEQGGEALENYPDFHRVVRDEQGVYRVTERRIAMRHRLSIGTITSDAAMEVRFLRGASLGTVEEGFISRLRPRDRFQFAGRTLELVAVDQLTAYVRKASARSVVVPRWQGGRMALSSELGEAVEAALAGPRDGPELQTLAPLLDLQARVSALPTPQTLLVETVHQRGGGDALFVYPFAGRTVHEGMAALFALRWGRLAANTFLYAVNDYGFVLNSRAAAPVDLATLQRLLSPLQLLEDLQEGLNLSEMARRQFRDIARIAGMLAPPMPGTARPSMRQLQASSGLMFDLLRRYDPGHLLLDQASREVLEAQMDVQALQAAFDRCAARRIDLQRPPSFTPLSFPLWAETVRGELSTEDWSTRVRRAAQALQARHG